jgi:hypothetical protein
MDRLLAGHPGQVRSAVDPVEDGQLTLTRIRPKDVKVEAIFAAGNCPERVRVRGRVKKIRNPSALIAELAGVPRA